MRQDKERFHPLSPVQKGRTSPVPFLIAGILVIALAWNARQNWVDALAPPDDQDAKHAPSSDLAEPRAAHARGNLAGLISADDYPVDALRKNEQGSATARMTINPSGRVSACEIVQSSGSHSLDRATCAILSRRARFTPARDSYGRPTEDTDTQKITWQLEG